MRKQLGLASVVLLLATACVAQDGLAIQVKGKQRLPEEAQEIYLSACGQSRPRSPKVTLVLGAEQDGVMRATSEIRLRKWNRHLFAQGVVIPAFSDLMSTQQELTLAKRAVGWADAMMTVQQLHK
jgi:hypothetical protein